MLYTVVDQKIASCVCRPQTVVICQEDDDNETGVTERQESLFIFQVCALLFVKRRLDR